jgi:cephalosporin-C deacetylase-like acetyl esterase
VPLVDLALSDLQTYRPELDPPHDLAERWDETLADARRHGLDLRVTPVGRSATCAW